MRQYLNAVFGNRDYCRSLGECVEKGTLSHAILIEGPEGSGKRTLAKELAIASLCEHRQDKSYPLPCRTCRACHLVENDLTPDVHFICRGDRATIGVDTVREVRADATLSATEFDCRFYIFEDAHTMTAQAQNALLKVMEEPPTNIKILLLTESADAMLSTVRSRSRLVRMERFTPSDIAHFLKHKHPELLPPLTDTNGETEALLLAAQGSIGSALRLLSPQNREAVKKEREDIFSLLTALCARSYAPLLKAISALPQKREEFAKALLLFHTALRDLILLTRAEAPPLSFFPVPEAIPTVVREIQISTLLAFVDAIEQTLEDLEKNANIATAQALLGSRLRGAQKVR